MGHNSGPSSSSNGGAGSVAPAGGAAHFPPASGGSGHAHGGGGNGGGGGVYLPWQVSGAPLSAPLVSVNHGGVKNKPGGRGSMMGNSRMPRSGMGGAGGGMGGGPGGMAAGSGGGGTERMGAGGAGMAMNGPITLSHGAPAHGTNTHTGHMAGPGPSSFGSDGERVGPQVGGAGAGEADHAGGMGAMHYAGGGKGGGGSGFGSRGGHHGRGPGANVAPPFQRSGSSEALHQMQQHNTTFPGVNHFISHTCMATDAAAPLVITCFSGVSGEWRALG